MRKLNPGIKYYPMECGHTKNKRVRLLINDHGSDGYWVWCCIVDHAYESNGYFFDSSEEEYEYLSSEICRKPPELISQIVESCIKRGLFDRNLHDTYKILTNDRMQVNFIHATYDRRRKGARIYIPQDHLLIPINELLFLGEKPLTNLFFAENHKSIWSEINISTISAEKPNISTEKPNISTETTTHSVDDPRTFLGRSVDAPCIDIDIDIDIERDIDIKSINTTVVDEFSDENSAGQKSDKIGVVERPQKSVSSLAKKSAKKRQKKPVDEKAPETILFNNMKVEWAMWYAGRNKNQKPNFTGKHAKSLSDLRLYFLRVAKELKAEDIYCEAFNQFKNILSSWEKLKPDKFLYRCIDVAMMSSKINEIINFLNNGGRETGIQRSKSSKGDDKNIGESFVFDKA